MDFDRLAGACLVGLSRAAGITTLTPTVDRIPRADRFQVVEVVPRSGFDPQVHTSHFHLSRAACRPNLMTTPEFGLGLSSTEFGRMSGHAGLALRPERGRFRPNSGQASPISVQQRPPTSFETAQHWLIPGRCVLVEATPNLAEGAKRGRPCPLLAELGGFELTLRRGGLFGRFRTGFGRVRPEDRSWRTPPRCHATFGRIWSHPPQSRSKFGPIRAKMGPTPTECSRVRPCVGQA